MPSNQPINPVSPPNDIDDDTAPVEQAMAEPMPIDEAPAFVPVNERRIGRCTFVWRSLLAALIWMIPLFIAYSASASLGGRPQGFRFLLLLCQLVAGLGLSILVAVQYVRHAIMPRLLDIGCEGTFRVLVIAAMLFCSYFLDLGLMFQTALVAMPKGLIKNRDDGRPT